MRDEEESLLDAVRRRQVSSRDIPQIRFLQLTCYSFTAVLLGLPKHLKDDDVQCEYPVDADDEYVTERGFQPTLPGESTKISSALALFRAARILSKVLEEVFPAQASYELSLKTLSDLSDELDAWSAALPPHLRLQFAQDKPSTGTISSRSPLLSLTYHYIRALIQRPAICASLGSRSSSHLIAMAGSCKHLVQIVQLLEERGMSFSCCLNKDETLVLAGFGLLYQSLGLEPSSKMLKDNHKMINAIIGILKKSDAPCAPEFTRVALSFMPRHPTKQTLELPAAMPRKEKHVATLSRHNSDPQFTINPASSLPASTKKQLKAIASRFTANTKMPRLDPSDHRRATVHNISLHPNGVPSQSQPSLQPFKSYDPSAVSRSEPARSPLNMYSRPSSTSARPSAPPQLKPKPRAQASKLLNLDYLPFGTEPEPPRPTSHGSLPVKPEPQPTDWEKLLGSLDNGTTNIYDACYGGPPVDALLDSAVLGMNGHNTSATTVSDAGIAWNADLWALCQTETNSSTTSAFTTSSGHPASVLSFSTDESSGNEDFSKDFTTGADWPLANSTSGNELYRGIVLPAGDLNGDDFGLSSSWDAGLNL